MRGNPPLTLEAALIIAASVRDSSVSRLSDTQLKDLRAARTPDTLCQLIPNVIVVLVNLCVMLAVLLCSCCGITQRTWRGRQTTRGRLSGPEILEVPTDLLLHLFFLIMSVQPNKIQFTNPANQQD